MIIETSRYMLRELSIEDANNMYLLNLDPDVIKYTGDAAFANEEEARKFLSEYDQYKKYGLGRWAVIDKSDNRFVGWCGLKYTPEQDEYDIGFRFFRSEWGKGIATETAKACIGYGFDVLNLHEIVGRAMKDNRASIRVLEKCGLGFVKNADFDGQSGLVYGIRKGQVF